MEKKQRINQKGEVCKSHIILERAKAQNLMAFKVLNLKQFKDHHQFALTTGAPGVRLPDFVKS